MKLAVILATLVMLSFVACAYFFSSGYMKQKIARYEGYSEICVDGVQYLQFISGASVKYNQDGTISKCK